MIYASYNHPVIFLVVFRFNNWIFLDPWLRRCGVSCKRMQSSMSAIQCFFPSSWGEQTMFPPPHCEVSNTMFLPLIVRWAIIYLPHCEASKVMLIPFSVRWANHVSSPHREVSKPCFFPSLRGEQTMLFPLILRWNHVSSPHCEMSNHVSSPHWEVSKPCCFPSLWDEQTMFLSLIFRLSYSKGCCYKTVDFDCITKRCGSLGGWLRLERVCLLRQITGLESRHLSKIQNGRHKQGVANT
jgi:hypothetical protein